MFLKIYRWLRNKNRTLELKDWYVVSWDDNAISRNASPPGYDQWSDKIFWADIKKICFEAEDHMASDNIYLYISDGEEAYSIPIEAAGGLELWAEIIDRGLFGAELALTENSVAGGLVCWPATKS